MRKLFLYSIIVVTITACTHRSNKPALQVGVAAAPINPPLGAFIAGDKQNRKFTAIHDSLYAKAVVFTNENEKLALITLDCIGLLYPDVLRIRQKAAELCGFPEDRIIVTSTHTHSGPDVVGIWGSDYQHSGIDSSYMSFLINTSAAQIQAAWENREAVTASTAETTFGEPWVQNICNEEIDRTVSILQLLNKQGKAIATLTNFACHPTFMDAGFSEISADYIHGYYQEMKKKTGGEALFLQGAIGGWVQPVDGAGTFDKAFNRGRELADAVLSALPNATPLRSTAISFRKKQIRLPVENEAWKQLAAIGTIQRQIQDSVQTEVTWFTIGDAQFVTHPGETAPFYGLETKKLMGNGPRFVLGLGNDALGYIIKPSFFTDKNIPHSEYLTGMSVGKETGPLMMKALNSIIPKSNQ
ncbi:MAG: alkaline ceramidase [Cyclobacteriaceae bacterium]|nr:alkaline ceramidase [Cyclobacteriaceae bacterium]